MQVPSANSTASAAAAAADGLGAASEQHADAQGFHPRRQVAATRGIELTLHERVHQVHDRHVAALHLEAARRLETEQPAADHDGLGAGPGAAEQRARVVERAEREHAVLVEPFDGRHPGGAAGREEQGVEGGHGAVLRRHGLRDRVDVRDAAADAQLDVVALVPFDRVERDVIRRLLAGQHRREQDPVVVDVCLVAEDRHVEPRRMLEDLLHAGHACHAVADDDQPVHLGIHADSCCSSKPGAPGGASTVRHAKSMISCTSGRHEPQPVPARVASQTACSPRAPSMTASMMSPLETALQSQICALSGMRSGDGSGVLNERGNSSSARLASSVRAVAERLEQRRHDGAVAHDDRADEPVAAHDQLLVDAARRLLIAHDLVAGVLRFLPPHHGDVETGDLEPGGRARAAIERPGSPAAQAIGEHLGLLPQRRHESVDASAVLGAFADRMDVRGVDAAEVVPDDDAAVDAEPGPAGELDIRPDAGREHDHVALERAAVLERDTGDMPVAEDGRGERLEVQLHTHLGELPLEDRAGRWRRAARP